MGSNWTRSRDRSSSSRRIQTELRRWAYRRWNQSSRSCRLRPFQCWGYRGSSVPRLARGGRPDRLGRPASTDQDQPGVPSSQSRALMPLAASAVVDSVNHAALNNSSVARSASKVGRWLRPCAAFTIRADPVCSRTELASAVTDRRSTSLDDIYLTASENAARRNYR